MASGGRGSGGQQQHRSSEEGASVELTLEQRGVPQLEFDLDESLSATMQVHGPHELCWHHAMEAIPDGGGASGGGNVALLSAARLRAEFDLVGGGHVAMPPTTGTCSHACTNESSLPTPASPTAIMSDGSSSLTTVGDQSSSGDLDTLNFPPARLRPRLNTTTSGNGGGGAKAAGKSSANRGGGSKAARGLQERLDEEEAKRMLYEFPCLVSLLYWWYFPVLSLKSGPAVCQSW
jgi:hypothetical protein